MTSLPLNAENMGNLEEIANEAILSEVCGNPDLCRVIRFAGKPEIYSRVEYIACHSLRVVQGSFVELPHYFVVEAPFTLTNYQGDLVIGRGNSVTVITKDGESVIVDRPYRPSYLSI